MHYAAAGIPKSVEAMMGGVAEALESSRHKDRCPPLKTRSLHHHAFQASHGDATKTLEDVQKHVGVATRLGPDRKRLHELLVVWIAKGIVGGPARDDGWQTLVQRNESPQRVFLCVVRRHNEQVELNCGDFRLWDEWHVKRARAFVAVGYSDPDHGMQKPGTCEACGDLRAVRREAPDQGSLAVARKARTESCNTVS